MDHSRRQTLTKSRARETLRMSLIYYSLACVASMLSALATRVDFLRLPEAIIWLLSGVLVSVSFTSVVAIRERSRSHVTRLRSELIRVYTEAIDRALLSSRAVDTP